MGGRRIEVTSKDVLVYRGMEFDQSVLEAIMNPSKRLLWAFIRREGSDDVRAIPYSESECIWLQESDVQQPEDIEV